MTRKLFVHVGPRKTATSTVQSFLRDHPNPAVVYPKVGLYSDGSHHKLVYRYFGENRQATRNLQEVTVDSLFKDVAIEAADPQANILISSELLSDASRDVGSFTRALLPYLGLSPADVRVVFVVREHFARAASWYNMQVRAPKRLGAQQLKSPDEFLDRHAPDVCYESLVRRLKDSDLPFVAINYQPSETLARRFFQTVGIPESELPADVERKRVGLSAKGLIAAMATNRVARTARERRRMFDAFATLSGAREAAGFIFGRESAERAELLFARDRDYLLAELGLTIDPPDREFACTLVLRQPELDEIAHIAAGFGPAGARIVKVAARYLSE